jgi:hypothetical protein
VPTLTQRITRAGLDAYRRVSASWSGAGGLSRGLNGVGGGVVTPATAAVGPDGKLRGVDAFAWRDALYSGDAYLPRCYGGGAVGILKSLGRWNQNVTDWETKSRIVPHYNAFRSIVDVYQHALSGKLGDGLEIDEKANGKPVYTDLPDLIGRVWRWSNLDAEKDPLIQTVANQGTAGLRIVYQAGDTPDLSRVYLAWDHPRYIKSVETDARGNVRHVVLKWTIESHDEDGRVEDSIEVRTELSADEFSLQYDGEEQLTPAERRNGLGVCPYALVRQRAVPDSPFGLHAYAGSEQAVHALNYGASELGSSVWDVIYPTWFATGGGKLPAAPWALDKSKLVYVQTAAGTPPPTMDPMVPTVPVLAALAYLQQTADWLLSAQPELVWAAIRLLAGISGEALARVQQPTEGCVMRARAMYEESIIRGVQIALSVGVYHGLPDFDLGRARARGKPPSGPTTTGRGRRRSRSPSGRRCR